MMRHVERIREKPESERHAIAVSVSVAITALVFIIWLVAFFHSIQSKSAARYDAEQAELQRLVDEQQQQQRVELDTQTQTILQGIQAGLETPPAPQKPTEENFSTEIPIE